MNTTPTYNLAPARPAEPPVPAIRFDGDRLRVEFGPADFGSAAAYELFKRAKRLPEYEIVLDAAGLAAGITAPARFASMLGVERPPTEVAPLPWPAHFTPEFDDQPAITQMALDAKRFAVWSDCGLGKTSVGLEWARQVSHRSLAAGGSGRVLVVTLNEIVPQWIEEARKFYGDSLPVARLRSREEMRAWCAGRPVADHHGDTEARSEDVESVLWVESKDGDPIGYELYRRHYSAKKNKKPKIKQFVGPGEKYVLIGRDGKAAWAWRKFIDDSGQTGVNCAFFRNEGAVLSSDLIREAMDFGWRKWPGERFYTNVDPEEIESPNPGYCFKQAGWRVCGKNKAGQTVLEYLPEWRADAQDYVHSDGQLSHQRGPDRGGEADASGGGSGAVGHRGDGVRALVITGSARQRPDARRDGNGELSSRLCAGGSGVPLIAVVNYEKFNHKTEAEQVVHELRHLAGIALDESSRLKTGGGKQKWALIKSARGIEFKLSLTATPAPNELMEFASQASFLERMRSESIADATNQIIWTYFTRCPKTHRWTIKQHARAAFFEWMASWSIYVRDPKKFGWRQTWSPPPEPEYFRHEIRLTAEQRQMVMDFNQDPKNVAEANVGSMFAGELNAIAATKLSQAAKGFIYTKAERTNDETLHDSVTGRARGGIADLDRGCGDAGGGVEEVRVGGRRPLARGAGGSASGRAGSDRRRARPVHSLKPAFVADLIVSEIYAGHQVLVWTVFDEETAILQRLLLDHPKLSGKAKVKGKAYRTIRDIDTLTGSTSETDRGTILTDFRAGHCRCLLTRADMLGYGMNLQFVGSMIFSGWSFSYEQFYQAIRRAYRHGQQARLRVHLPVVPELEGQMYDAIVRKQRQHEEAIAEMEGNYVRARQGVDGKERAA